MSLINSIFHTSFLMAILWNPRLRRLVLRFPLLRKQWFSLLSALAFVVFIVYIFMGDDIFMTYLGRSQKEMLLAELGPEFEGTYREKYLRGISESELWTDAFYDKWNIMGHLDELVDEPIEDLEYNEEVGDLMKMIEEFETTEEPPRKFMELDTLEKINAYAEVLLPQSNFVFRPVQDEIYKDVYNPTKFKTSRLKKWNKIKALLDENDLSKLEVNEETFEGAIQSLRERKIGHNEASALRVKNSLDHLKTFGSLFLDPAMTLGSESGKMCANIEREVFPWLSGQLPDFQTYNLKSNKVEHKKFKSDTLCFVKKLQVDLEGRGIVVTASDALIPELAGLISLLKVNGNKLPMQIVHRNDITQANIKHLVKIASDPVMKLPSSWDAKKLPMSKITTFDLTFVDVSKVIDPKYKAFFGGFGMKLLALLFNSFEEVIMLDTDTVPLLPLTEYFQMERYMDTKTLFFRDREANSFLYDGVVAFFKSFLNSDYENHFLGLAKASDETLNNRFFGDTARHYMESGLFVINKKEKFNGVLVSVVLQFFKLFTGSLHGEKEFIWLGQEYMSNRYSFNKYGAVAIGELSTGREEQGLKSHELCSTHPGHLDDDGQTLLWFNSGFMTCKKPQSYFKDVNYAVNKGKSLQELKLQYVSPLLIKSALIPPPAEYLSTSFAEDNAIESNQMIDPELNAEITPQQLFDTEPSRSWIMTPHCSNYLWCAYDIIQGGETGKVVNFRPALTELWQFWGDTWVGYFKGAKSSASGDLGYFEDKYKDELGLDDPEEGDDKEENKEVYDETEGNSLIDEAKKAVLGDTTPRKPKDVKANSKLLTKGGKSSEILDELDNDDDSANAEDAVSPLVQKVKEKAAEAGEDVAEEPEAQVARKKSGADKLSQMQKFKNKDNAP